jgi:integrase
VVTLPDVIMSELVAHIEEYAAPGADGLVFGGPKGAPLRRPNFTRFWQPATRQAGLEGTHFHDLRHAGNTLAATSSATLRELMGRMGHASTRAR